MSKYYSKTRWSEETSTVLPPSTYIVLQFNKEVKVIERFVKAVIWSCESALIYIKWRLSTKKHIKLVFHSSSILYFLSFFFPVLKFTLKTLGHAVLNCSTLDWAPLEAVAFCCTVFPELRLPSRSRSFPIRTTTK